MNNQNKKTLGYYHKAKLEELGDDNSDYYFKVMDLLIDYYNTKDDEEETDSDDSVIEGGGDNFNDHPTEEIIMSPSTAETTLRSFVQMEENTNNASLLYEYMERLNLETDEEKTTAAAGEKNILKTDICAGCGKNNTLILDVCRSCFVCEECGCTKFTFISTDRTSYVKTPMVECNNFSYRRYDHFVEWLNKFHNIEKSKIPSTVIDQIKNEIKKLQINHTTSDTLIQILKKTGNSKFTGQVYQILSLLQHKKLPTLPKQIQSKMKTMFKETQQPFAVLCPTSRTNFLSYSYVIRKFLEILKQNEYIKFFPLLKSKEKLYQQDLIWKDMCRYLNWPYNPSI